MHEQPLVPEPPEESVKGTQYEHSSVMPKVGQKVEGESKDKTYSQALVISALTGLIGGDRFYLERYMSAVLKLMTLGGLGIWAMIDLVALSLGLLKAKDGKPLKGYRTSKHIAIPVVCMLTALYFIVWLAFFVPLFVDRPPSGY